MRYLRVVITLFSVTLLIHPFHSLALTATPTAATQKSIQKEITQEARHNHIAPADSALGWHVRHRTGDGSACRAATPEEARQMSRRDPNMPVSEVAGEVSAQQTGLRIVLRATQRLQNSPVVMAAFQRAKAAWESLIQTPVTIIVDVDFGPDRFGTDDYPQGVLGSTDSQLLGSLNLYASVRSNLIAKASSAQEAALYNSLPPLTVPTELGTTTAVFTPSATLRALGILPAVADPAVEDLGDPPSIGFNSNFPFDFDPSNGIDSNKVDFDAVAVHELGHVLGFSSLVGGRELSPSFPIALSLWDLFRFRPGVTGATFATSQRLLLAGGAHNFFAGAGQLELSTGRIDGSGGDGNQASHWKDDDITNRHIGIMDPNLPDGVRETITPNDLAAVDAIGYQLVSGGGGGTGGDNPPNIASLTGDLDGDVLTLRGIVNDSDGDMEMAEVSLLDGLGRVIGSTDPFDVGFDDAQTVNFTMRITNLNSFPSAMRATVVFIDGNDNRSAAVIADFSRADPGGPSLTSGSFTNSKLKLKGRGLSGQIQVEINGLLVASGFNNSSKKVQVKASLLLLNLRSGANRVRIKNGLLRSNLLVINL